MFFHWVQYAVAINTYQLPYENPALCHKAHEKGEELFDAVADLEGFHNPLNMKLWKYQNQAIGLETPKFDSSGYDK